MTARRRISALADTEPSVDRLWTIQDDSYYLGVPVATLHYWHHLGQGSACASIGRHLRYRSDDVLSWVDQQTAS